MECETRRAWTDYAAECGCLFFCAMLALVLVGLLSLCVGRVKGAPVPPEPKDLTVEMLAGQWRYAWGDMTDGRLWLYPDGYYSSYHRPEDGPVLFGRWYVRGRTLVLVESRFNPEFGTLTDPQRYEIHLPSGTAGKCGSVPVRLSDRAPFAED